MTDEGQAAPLDLSRFLAALDRRRRVIAVVALTMVAMALVLSFLQAPVYQAEARIAIDAPGQATVFEPVTAAARIDPGLVVETELEVLKSDGVQALVSEALGPVEEVEASRVGDTLLIDVMARSTDPRRAAAVTNAYVRSYIELRRQQAADQLLATGDQLRSKVAELQSQIDDLGAGADAARRQALVAQQARFSERLDQLEIEAALQSGGADVVTQAGVPDAPVAPTPLRNAVLALTVGVLVGGGLAVALEYRDDVVRSREDLSDAVKPVPLLGGIPLVPGWQRGSRPQVVGSGQAGVLPAGEAYRALRTAVILLGVERPLSTIQLTSAVPGDGKTTTLANLGVVLASAGQRVAMVDCDLRRPTLHTAFGADNSVGLTSVLAGDVPLATALQDVPSEGELILLSSGGVAPNPSELLGAKRTSEVLFALQSKFDVVLVDSPPVLSVTDAALLSVWVDATLLVVSAGVTTRRQARSAVEVLRQADAPLAGAILNRTDPRTGYGYGYYQEPAERRRFRTDRREPPAGLASGGQRPAKPAASGEDRIGLFDPRPES